MSDPEASLAATLPAFLTEIAEWERDWSTKGRFNDRSAEDLLERMMHLGARPDLEAPMVITLVNISFALSLAILAENDVTELVTDALASMRLA